MNGADWEAALSRGSASAGGGAGDGAAASLATPHPALTTALEAAAWEAALRPQPRAPLVAAVECGSHSTRLLITDGTNDLDRLSLDTCLGSDLGSDLAPGDGSSHPITIRGAATLAALSDFAARLRARGAPRARAVGTAALRECGRGAAAPFLAAAAAALGGCPIEVLSGDEEGALAFAGAASSLPNGRPCLLVDLGGRSTEFCFGAAGEARPDWVESLPLGCLRVAAAAGGAPGWRAAAEAVLGAEGSGLLARLRAAGPGWRLVVTGGTVTSAAAVLLGLRSYDHARVHMARLRGAQLLRLADELSSPDAQARAVEAHPWLTPERAASLAPGCAALAAVADWLEAAAQGGPSCSSACGASGGAVDRGGGGGGPGHGHSGGHSGAVDRGSGGGGSGEGSGGAELLVSDRDLLDGLALSLLAGGQGGRPEAA
ncbi:hypothetical protein Rsub_12444 [Raphidocelis subcapitata]|uniref:Ppx/GppA phosphatase N-terminal domain-containing protein n=1 Tax=Raphidocelis subcapitata TaxID=307507 RepID=A0A2V0PIV1_9CHLO|nr:hypothetical protein Rsub_12444 [Raphidocelis subcapitata]|eukprot:GBF99731.1 hypothetical protein Rsub_12444 [Raphidocelis subcapitata]